MSRSLEATAGAEWAEARRSGSNLSTCFALDTGSVRMHTAGSHFAKPVVEELAAPGTMKPHREPRGIYQFDYRKPRFRASFQVFIQAQGQPQLLEGRSIDISEDGLSASVSEPLALESEVILILSLPGPHSYQRIPARVTHQQEQNHGFTFVFTTPVERDHLLESLSLLSADRVRALSQTETP